MGEHPTTAELERLLNGGLEFEQTRLIVRHLLTGCKECRSFVASMAGMHFPRRPRTVLGSAAAFGAHAAAIPPHPHNPQHPGIPATPETPGIAAAQTPAASRWTAPRPDRGDRSERFDRANRGHLAAAATQTLDTPAAHQALLTRAASTPSAASTASTPSAASATSVASPLLPPLADPAPAAGIALSAETDAAYDRAIDRALASVVRYGVNASREAKKVKQVLAVLEQKGVAGFCELPQHLRGLAGYEALLERSWALRHDDPRQMVQLCELATVVGTGLSASRHGREQVRDLQCRAAIELANAYRVIGRPDDAQGSLNEALEFFRKGTQNRLMAARLFVVQAQVSGDRRSFDTALAAFDSAIQVYREFGEPHQVGDTLIKKGMYTGYACRPEEALKLLNEGLELIDATTHPELALLAVHNIANILVDLAKYREARTLLWRHLPLYNQYGGRVLRLKLRLLEGRIHAGIGEPHRAERDLDEARRGFEEIGQPYMATLVLLDLAVLHIRLGRDDDARREALAAADIFLGLNIGREAAVAMMLLKSTVKFRLATTSVLLEEMSQFMRAAEHDPQLSFHSFLS